MYFSARRGGVTSFNPLSLSPALWLSDTGSDASIWPDLSGNERNATQATTANQPAIVANAQNGRQVRRFDGVNDILSTAAWTSSISVDVFIAVKATNWHRGVTQALASHGYSEDFNNGQSYGQIVGSTGGDWVVNDITCYGRGYQGNPRAIAAQPSGSDFRMLNFAMSASQSFIKINGATISQRVTRTANCVTSTTPFRVGSNLTSGEFWDGDIAEILVFPTALSSTDRQAVELYLLNKWGFTFWNDSAAWDDSTNWTD